MGPAPRCTPSKATPLAAPRQERGSLERPRHPAASKRSSPSSSCAGAHRRNGVLWRSQERCKLTRTRVGPDTLDDHRAALLCDGCRQQARGTFRASRTLCRGTPMVLGTAAATQKEGPKRIPNLCRNGCCHATVIICEQAARLEVFEELPWTSHKGIKLRHPITNPKPQQ